MPSDSTFVEVKNAFQAIAGLESLTSADEFFLQNSTNRAVSRAYNASDSWPRYLTIGEERDIVSLIVSGLATGSSVDKSGVTNGNYILLGQDSGDTSIGGANAVAGTNVYYNPAIGTRTSTQIISTVIYKNKLTNKWKIDFDGEVNISGSKITSIGSGTNLLTEADSVTKDKPSEVVTWDLVTSAVSGTPLVVDAQLIPYAQTGKNTVGEFLRIYRKKPFLNNSSIEYEFYVDSLGANVLNLVASTDNSVFVNYKKELTTGFTPDSTNIPSEFVDYIIYTALSDFYTGDGQIEKAAASAVQANAMLDLELLRLDKKANNNTINKKFSTYVNRQAR
jgi:hypothetical protein